MGLCVCPILLPVITHDYRQNWTPLSPITITKRPPKGDLEKSQVGVIRCNTP